MRDLLWEDEKTGDFSATNPLSGPSDVETNPINRSALHFGGARAFGRDSIDIARARCLRKASSACRPGVRASACRVISRGMARLRTSPP